MGSARHDVRMRIGLNGGAGSIEKMVEQAQRAVFPRHQQRDALADVADHAAEVVDLALHFIGIIRQRIDLLTRERLPKQDLIRFVLAPNGEIVPDLKERLPGRGVWVTAAHDKVAEAAKVIENTQRDLNIAFMNELSAIFHVLGIDTKDVLAAARERAPLEKTRALLLEAGICSEDELTALEVAAKAEVDDAIARAMVSPVTPPSETIVDVFADVDCVPQRGHYPLRDAEGNLPTETKAMSFADAVKLMLPDTVEPVRRTNPVLPIPPPRSPAFPVTLESTRKSVPVLTMPPLPGPVPPGAPYSDELPETLDALIAKGFKFVTVSELHAMDRPVVPKPKATPAPPGRLGCRE